MTHGILIASIHSVGNAIEAVVWIIMAGVVLVLESASGFFEKSVSHRGRHTGFVWGFGHRGNSDRRVVGNRGGYWSGKAPACCFWCGCGGHVPDRKQIEAPCV